MRIVLIVLTVVAVALLALPSGLLSQSGAKKAFAAEQNLNPVPVIDPCYRACAGTTTKYCAVALQGIRGCSHIVNNNCIFVICPPDDGDPE